ncbi:MAG: hypothetical protein DHS20C18_42840 [Saprospiraceae bacterium]|nr:MAG: hypothetical protein DHS20C18_42840 [Saprospiraceae bacterium]
MTLTTHAQSSYEEAMQQGDGAVRAGQYKTAINKYFAAEAFDPNKKDIVKVKVNTVFARIDSLLQVAELARDEALKQTREAQKQKQVAEAAKLETQNALTIANQLINAFYFYEDRFALAFKTNKFYFIDKKGIRVPQLGQWVKAEQFDDRTGFAKVKKKEQEKLLDYLLDTFGNIYLVAYHLKDLDRATGVLDLSGKSLDVFPARAMAFPMLRVLNLNGNFNQRNIFRTIPAAITQLKVLQSLQLSYCQLENIPPQIGELQQLTSLDLSGNLLNDLPHQIGQLNKLVYLDLSRNAFRRFPAQVAQLQQLKQLDLYDNQLTGIPKEVRRLHQLTHLDLSGNKLNNLPKEIGLLQNLTDLDLRDNPIPTEEREIIQNLLPNCRINF